MYRLVRVSAFDVSKGASYRPKNYTLFNPLICKLIHKLDPSDQTGFCASGDGRFGNEGDPFIVKIKAESWTSPVYQIGMDAVHLEGTLGEYLDLFPYVKWIRNTLADEGNMQ